MKLKNNPPKATIKRLSIYLRYLSGLALEETKVISSYKMAQRLALNPAQVRKDLSYFGKFGKRGVGYNVEQVREDIIKILGIQKIRNVGIVGAGGSLGRALSLYRGFEKRNFKIVALFDNNPELIGQSLKGASEILSIDTLEEVVKSKDIEILILTVPGSAVRGLCDKISKSGVRAVLNFAPYKMICTKKLVVHNVDLTTELESISYHLAMNESETLNDI